MKDAGPDRKLVLLVPTVLEGQADSSRVSSPLRVCKPDREAGRGESPTSPREWGLLIPRTRNP